MRGEDWTALEATPVRTLALVHVTLHLGSLLLRAPDTRFHSLAPAVALGHTPLGFSKAYARPEVQGAGGGEWASMKKGHFALFRNTRCSRTVQRCKGPNSHQATRTRISQESQRVDRHLLSGLR